MSEAPAPTVKGLYNCGYFSVEFLHKAAESLLQKAPSVKRGLDKFSAAEELAYDILKSEGFL